MDPLLPKAKASHSETIRGLKRRSEAAASDSGMSNPRSSGKKQRTAGPSVLQYFSPSAKGKDHPCSFYFLFSLPLFYVQFRHLCFAFCLFYLLFRMRR